jgi:hypothetical protein
VAKVYSVRLAAQHSGTHGSFTVPVGYRCVIRDVCCFNADPLSTNDAQLVHVESDCTVFQRTLGPQEWTNDEMRLVVEEGETVNVLPGFDVDMYVSGYYLSLP